ncbi:hypothetical protein EBT16_08595, partial [bacterium]|nr:hypothetical protein [bacterium]
AQIKKMGSPLFLDAGNAFFSGPRMNPDRKDLENARADLIARSYQLMGLAAFSPGEGDFSAGGDRFWQLIKKTGALAVSANLEENKGRGTFKPYLVWSGGGIKILVTGLTAFNASVIPDGIQEKPARAALKALWKDVEAQKPDQVVVLSHLGRTEDEKIAREFPGVFIVGSKSLDFLLEPLKLGNSFVFEVGIQGQRLGEIVLEKGKAGPTTAKLTELGMEYDKPNGVKKLIQ